MSSDASVTSVGIGDGFGVKVFFRPLRDGEVSRIDEEEDFVLGLLAWIRDHMGTVVAGVAFQAHMGGVARGARGDWRAARGGAEALPGDRRP